MRICQIRRTLPYLCKTATVVDLRDFLYQGPISSVHHPSEDSSDPSIHEKQHSLKAGAPSTNLNVSRTGDQRFKFVLAQKSLERISGGTVSRKCERKFAEEDDKFDFEDSLVTLDLSCKL